MNILIGGETSGMIRDAFRRRGFNAMSCDLLPSSTPGPHYEGDMRDVICSYWDLAIFHPSCQYLCGSGIHWNNRGRGWDETEKALDFVRYLMAAPIRRKVIENPVGVISSRIRPASQYIQPYDFGDDASKKTGLWLEGLPLLIPTERIAGRMVMYKGKMVERWANQTDSGQNKLPPSADRWQLRSETYPGIANAIADQYGKVLLNDPHST